MAKSNHSAVLLRNQQISSLLIKGYSREDIVQYCAVNWEIGERQADKYIHSAKALISESVKKDVEYDYSIALKRFECILRLAEEKGNLKVMVQVVKEISTLQGLYRTQVEHTGHVQFINNIPE